MKCSNLFCALWRGDLESCCSVFPRCQVLFCKKRKEINDMKLEKMEKIWEANK